MKDDILENLNEAKPFYKRPIFIIGASLIVVILLIIIIAVASSSSAPIEEKEDIEENRSIIPNEKNVKFLGRAVMIQDTLFMGYSSCGAEFKVKAKRLNITIAGDSGAYGTQTDTSARIAVFVDEKRVLDQLITKREQDFVIFSESETKEAIVRIIKISESSRSTAGLVSIDINAKGTISPTEKKKLKIEFIGDSITCGYGIDETNRNAGFKTSTEDSSKTYAYKTAETLDADYSMVATSGAGVISAGSYDGKRNEGNLIPNYYTKLGFTWGNIYKGVQFYNQDWDFSLFVPNFIVINLGTNDHTYTQGDANKEKEFQDGYVTFLEDIRKHNQDAKIICSLGIMGQELFPAIEAAVSTYKSKTGDNKVSTLKFDKVNYGEDGAGAGWHPSEKTNIKAAGQLVSAIKQLM